jgi:hypothetical protein
LSRLAVTTDTGKVQNHRIPKRKVFQTGDTTHQTRGLHGLTGSGSHHSLKSALCVLYMVNANTIRPY